MDKMDEIERAIEVLSRADRTRLRAWLDELDARLLEAAIERDAKAGKLDRLAAAARANMANGQGEEL